jgi:broad specificity phosphatase PhoE
VFASDLGRAVETVKIAFGGSGIAIHLDARLRECNYGQWNGMRVTQLAAERRRRICLPFPGGESYRDVVDRVAGFLEDLAQDWDRRRMVVVGHSATRWALDHLLAAGGLGRRAVPVARRLALRASRRLAADLWGELRSPDAW